MTEKIRSEDLVIAREMLKEVSRLAEHQLAEASSAQYLDGLVGTLGADPFCD